MCWAPGYMSDSQRAAQWSQDQGAAATTQSPSEDGASQGREGRREGQFGHLPEGKQRSLPTSTHVGASIQAPLQPIPTILLTLGQSRVLWELVLHPAPSSGTAPATPNSFLQVSCRQHPHLWGRPNPDLPYLGACHLHGGLAGMVPLHSDSGPTCGHD